MSLEFLPVVPVASARALWADALQRHVAPVGEEAAPVGFAAALGRVLAAEVHAGDDVPGFDRSTVDGYAVRAAETFGASEALPAYLDVGEPVQMGASATRPLRPVTAVPLATGGMLPPGADACVMIEYCELLPDGQLAVNRPVVPGENVITRGEDVRAGAVVLQAGHVLRPQDLGVLAAVGVHKASVRRLPRVAILSTGDELVGIDSTPGPGQVRDINAHALAGLVEQGGGLAVLCGIARDEAEELSRRAAQALAEADMLLISGGSSIGSRDYVAQAIGRLGKPGVLVHGVAMRPGKPTILAVAGGKPVLGLPGHPASALVVFWLFGLPAIAHLSGRLVRGGSARSGIAGSNDSSGNDSSSSDSGGNSSSGLAPAPARLQPAVRARLGRNLPSAPGRDDFYRVALAWDDRAGEWRAEPVFGKSGLVSTLVRGDGLVQVAAEQDGLAAGDVVEVLLFGYR